MGKTPTYNKIRDLALELQKETKVKRRRDVGEQLLGMISKEDVRKKLAMEATPSSVGPGELSVAAARCNALSKLWTLIIHGAIGAAESIGMGASKAKLTLDDITLPHKLLEHCSKPDEAFQEGIATPKLSRKTVRHALKFCLTMLQNDTAIELGEEKILEMLNHMVSRVEYVGNFKYTPDLANILSELSWRLEPEMEARNYTVFLRAAQCLDSLFRSCKTLGIQVHYLLSDSIELVSNWCKAHIKANTVKASSDALSSFFGTVASLLQWHPEYAIGPMKRYGRAILSFCRRCYPAANGTQKYALNEYLLAHILVAQVAGKIQGLLTGDFGSLGKASFTEKQVSSLLQLAIDDVEKIASMQESTSASHRRQKGRHVVWRELVYRKRQHLELVARLMACAQRLYLSRVEWALLDDQNEELTNMLGSYDGPGDDWIEPKLPGKEPCPVEEFAASPWVEYVIRNLYEAAPQAVEDLQGDNSMIMFSQESTNQTTTSNATIPSLNFPILKYLSNGSAKYDSSPISALSFLPIVGACAEAFPAGECWTSSSQNNWHRLSSTDPQREEVLHCHGCSPDDLSIIIYLLSNLLNVHGGPGGDIAIQGWTLVTLTRLSETSAILLRNFSKSSAALTSLGVAWRRVWTTIFRSDLRYQAYTDGAAQDSLGELVLVLLTEMVYWNCTDPITSLVSSPSNRPQSFVHDHQSQVWTLPAFADYRSIKTTSAFELICSMLQKAGLSETGGDSIDVSLARVLFSDQNHSELDSSGVPHHLGRRRRLMCVTTGGLESILRSYVSEGNQELSIQRFAAVLSASIVALVNGRGVQIERTFNARSSLFTTKDDCVFSSFIPFEEMAFNRFQLTCIPLREHVPLDDTTRNLCFRSLWSLPDIRDFALVKPIESVRAHLDCTLSVSSRLRDRLASQDLSDLASADFISESESDRLRKFLRHFFEKRIFGGDGHALPDGGRTSLLPISIAEEYNSADSGDEGATKPPCWRTLAMKVALSCSLSHRHDALQQELEHIMMDMSSFLDQTTSNLLSISDLPRDFLRVSSDLMQIMQTLLELSSSYPRINIDRCTVDSVIGVCKSLMKGYAQRTRQGYSVHNQTDLSAKAQARSVDAVDMLDDDDDFDDAPKREIWDRPEHNLSDESDSDDGFRAKRKRRSFLGSEHETRKHRRIASEKPCSVPPDWLCAQRVATILLILDPCLSNCELVCQTLLGTDLDLDPATIQYDMDIRSTLYVSEMLNVNAVFLNETATREFKIRDDDDNESRPRGNDSPIVILCRVVELLRSCAGPYLPSYLFGYETSARQVSFGESEIRGSPITEDEARNIVDVLKVEDGIQSRPCIRADRVRAGTAAFKSGGNTFHSLFDKEFANRFVKTSIIDSSALVRREGRVALGCALRSLDERRTSESILKLICPVTLSDNSDEIRQKFGDWCEKADLCPPSDDDELKNLFIEDSIEVMESFSILCRSMVAGCARSMPIFRKQLFHLVKVSSMRPDLQLACFQALDEVASIRNYPKVDEMIEQESEGLLKLWLEIGEGVSHIPLLLTSPKLLRHLLRAGQGHLILSRPNSESEEADGIFNSTDVGHDASISFIAKYRRFLVPLTLIQIVSKKPHLAASTTNGERQGLPADQQLKDLALLLVTDVEEEKKVLTLLRYHISDIQAFCIPMRRCGAEFEKIGKEVMQFVASVVPEDVINAHMRKNAHVVVRRILELNGKCEDFAGVAPGSQIAYLEGVLDFVESFCSPKSVSGDLLMRAGSSATENLIVAFLWLDKAYLEIHQKQRWSSIELLCKLVIAQVQRNDYDQIQYGFCIHILTEVILNGDLACLRLSALTTIKSMLNEILPLLHHADLQMEVGTVMQRLVGACFYVHESGQQELLSYCCQKQNDFHKLLRRSLGMRGMLGIDRDDNVWGWERGIDEFTNDDAVYSQRAVTDFGASVNGNLNDTITTTFCILEWIVDNESSLGFDPQAFVSTTPPYAIRPSDLEVLKALNPHFCAQTLAERFSERIGRDWDNMHSGIKHAVTGIQKRLSNRHSWMIMTSEKTVRQNDKNTRFGLASLNMDQRLLHAELLQLERILQTGHGTNDFTILEMGPRDLECLVRELSLVCGAPCPEALRFAASRCLGKISPESIVRHSSSEEGSNPSDWVEDAIIESNIILEMQAKSMEVLGECLKSPKTDIAMLAAETLEALFATREGSDCWKLMGPASQRLLAPFAKRGETQRVDTLSLPDEQVAELKVKARFETNIESEENWCWSEPLWLCSDSDESSFEDWICCLVPALIDCCYKKRPKQARSGGEFFRKCQKMCALEHGFSSSLFPCIVIDLLLGTKGVLSSTFAEEIGVDSSERTEINDRLSKSFEVLMGHSSAVGSPARIAGAITPNSKALSLAVETLDLLRRITQHNFLAGSHKRNKASLPDRSYGEQSEGKKSKAKSARAETYNEGLPPPARWKGLPYGVVLRLDGLLVAKSCLQARRFATALFFVDFYLNTQLGSSGGTLEQLSNESTGDIASRFHKTACDISGLAAPKEDSSMLALAAECAGESALSAISVMRKCFEELHEDEALQAIETQGSALKFVHTDFLDKNCLEERYSASDALQRLDIMSSSMSGSATAHFLVAEGMARLGVRPILKTYIQGLVSNADLVQSMDESRRKYLREKWFESTWHERQWDTGLLRATSSARSSQRSIEDPDTNCSTKSLDLSTGTAGGFYESITSALDLFILDDFDSCRSFLAQSRRGLLRSIADAGGEESSLAGMISVIDQLQGLGDFESLVSTSLGPSQLLKKWGLSTGTEDGENVTRRFTSDGEYDREQPASPHNVLVSQGFSSGMREILLRVFQAKNMDGENKSIAHRGLVCHLWFVCSKARKSGFPNVAEAALQRLLSVSRLWDEPDGGQESSSLDTILQVRLEESKILESRGDFAAAIRRLNQAIDHLNQKKRTDGDLALGMQRMLADALITCGSWMANYKVQQGRVVLDSYLRPGEKLAAVLHENERSKENVQRATLASLSLAQLVANLFEALSTRLQGLEWRKGGDAVEASERELQRCELLKDDAKRRSQEAKNKKASEKASGDYVELSMYIQTLKKETDAKKVERADIESSVDTYLNLAVQSFATALSLADTGNGTDMSRHVCTMVSLWFSSYRDKRRDDNINTLVADHIEQIPTFRFVFLANQLLSRLENLTTSGEEAFQSTLQRLIFKMCADHPYHCLVQLIALSNGKNVGSGVGGRNASAFLENVGDSKIVAAKAVITTLKKKAPKFIGNLLESYRMLTDAYIFLANAQTEKIQKTKTKNIPFSMVCSSQKDSLDQCLGRSRNRVDCPPCVLTAPPPLRPGCDYGDGVEDPIGGERIAGFEPHFSVAESGIHRPKIVMCLGSNGGRFRQLAKGEDEIRQDAVMSQVFTYVNELMLRRAGSAGNMSNPSEGNRRAARLVRHKLEMVTYNIVPLSPASGVLEWVENTMGFGDYMNDKKASGRGYTVGAHSKYYPNEWNNSLCRVHLAFAPPEEKRRSFDEICRRHSPVFRFFFVERFGHSMQAWHAARMRYTRSVAVSSIVGHILGIGDRHTSNILVHQKTGEVVHIDFGIVFEQGKLLNTPERIPFRLTRNMVDGMGPSGTEGTFSHAAEETSRVLRDNASALLTILSAIVSDPLYRWSVSPVKARRRQAQEAEEEAEQPHRVEDNDFASASAASLSSKEEHNKAAQQAVAKIDEKLKGFEDGTSGEQQSVEGQVQLLITTARDQDSLCQMYHGWSPWI